MPGKKPFVRRFGQVDFDSMISLPGAAANDADIFVTRRGAFGANRTLTRAQIIAGAGVVPDPLLLNDGSAIAPTYSFTASPGTGPFSPAVDQYAISVAGVARWNFSTDLFQGENANGPWMQNIVSNATTPNLGPRRTNLSTGIGIQSTDILSLIAGNVQIAQAKEVVGANQFIVSPGANQNNAAAPSLALGDGDSGLYEVTDDFISMALGGVSRWNWTSTFFGAVLTGSPALLSEVSSNTNPTLIPDAQSSASGLGGITGQPSLIANGQSGMSVSESGGAAQIGFYGGSPIALQTGVAVTTAAVHAALVALRLITA